jgi:hypothetical protein
MKNIDYVIKKTSKELGLPEDQVKTVLNEYWKAGMSNIIHMKSTTTTFRHIGNFTVSKFKLRNYLKKMFGRLRRYKKEGVVKQDVLDENIQKLRTALEQRDILAKHYNSMFKKKQNGI